MTNSTQNTSNTTPQTTNILLPSDQVFVENKEIFTEAGLSNSSLSAQAPQGAQMGTQTDLQALPEQQRKAVEKAMEEGYFISVGGKTYQPTQEGVERRGKREAITQAAQNGGRNSLVAAGLWDEEKNTPKNLDRIHKSTNNNAELSSSDEDDRKAEALLNGYRVEGNWWERNKDWMIPLLTALAGTALGFALAKCFDSNNEDGANAATQLISQATSNSNATNSNQAATTTNSNATNSNQAATTTNSNATNNNQPSTPTNENTTNTVTTPPTQTNNGTLGAFSTPVVNTPEPTTPQQTIPIPDNWVNR